MKNKVQFLLLYTEFRYTKNPAKKSFPQFMGIYIFQSNIRYLKKKSINSFLEGQGSYRPRVNLNQICNIFWDM